MRRALPVQAIGKGDILLAQALHDGKRPYYGIGSSFKTSSSDPCDVYNELITYINRKMLNELIDEAVTSISLCYDGVSLAIAESVAEAFRKEGWDAVPGALYIEIHRN